MKRLLGETSGVTPASKQEDKKVLLHYMFIPSIDRSEYVIRWRVIQQPIMCDDEYANDVQWVLPLPHHRPLGSAPIQH